MKEFGIASAILFLVLGVLFAVGLDFGYALSWTPGFYLFAALPLLVALLAWRERVVQFAMVAYAVVFIALPFLTLSPVKPFRQFFSHVQPGMTEAEVTAMLTEQFPTGGRFPRPVQSRTDDGDLWFQLDPNDGAYNAELVVVKMQDGRAVSKEYLPD